MANFREQMPPGALPEPHFAVIYAPRRTRDRYPETTVEVVASAEAAVAGADADQKRYAAKVLGPFRSAEGVRLFYLEEWLS